MFIVLECLLIPYAWKSGWNVLSLVPMMVVAVVMALIWGAVTVAGMPREVCLLSPLVHTAAVICLAVMGALGKQPTRIEMPLEARHFVGM